MAGCHKPLWQEPKKSSQISDPFCFSPMMIIMIRLISPISKLIKMLLLIVVKNGKKTIFFSICFSIYYPHFFDIPFLFRHKIDFPITTFFWFSSFRKQFSSLFTNIKHAPKIPFSVPHIVCPFMVWSSLLYNVGYPNSFFLEIILDTKLAYGTCKFHISKMSFLYLCARMQWCKTCCKYKKPASKILPKTSCHTG